MLSSYVPLQLVQDESQGDLRKTAGLMSEDKRQQKLGELKEQRRQWRESGPTKETEDEQTDILRVSHLFLYLSCLIPFSLSPQVDFFLMPACSLSLIMLFSQFPFPFLFCSISFLPINDLVNHRRY